LLAALIVTACQGRVDLRRWGRDLRTWRIDPRWYLAVVLVPIVVHLVNVGINHVLGAPLPTAAQWAGWTEVPGNFLFMLVLVGIGEEAGWTAFAAPMLLRRHSLLVSWVVLASARILWHLPLMLSGEMPWVVGILGNAGFQLVVLIMFCRMKGGWPLAAVWHASLNAFGGLFVFRMVTGDDQARLGLLLGLAYMTLAIAMALLSRASVTASPAIAGQRDAVAHPAAHHG
jgi:membrane protease YdiL (CAAX protease family)